MLAGAVVPGPAAARHGFLRAHHHWQGVCSVLSRRPCAPTVCSVFHRGPCVPEIEYPIGQDLRLTIVSAASDKKADSAATNARPASDDANAYTRRKINTIREAFNALRACWIPPPENEARAHMQMSVRFSFKRNGGIIAAPRITYKSPDAPPETVSSYQKAITAALDRCTPLPLTPALGGAIAGRPIAIRFVDNRKQK